MSSASVQARLGDSVKEPQRCHRDGNRAGRKLFVLGQMDQPGPDLGGTELFRRSTKVAGEPEDIALKDRVLQLLAVAWIGTIGAAVLLG